MQCSTGQTDEIKQTSNKTDRELTNTNFQLSLFGLTPKAECKMEIYFKMQYKTER